LRISFRRSCTFYEALQDKVVRHFRGGYVYPAGARLVVVVECDPLVERLCDLAAVLGHRAEFRHSGNDLGDAGVRPLWIASAIGLAMMAKLD
jgi:hypothetical protein